MIYKPNSRKEILKMKRKMKDKSKHKIRRQKKIDYVENLKISILTSIKSREREQIIIQIVE